MVLELAEGAHEALQGGDLGLRVLLVAAERHVDGVGLAATALLGRAVGTRGCGLGLVDELRVEVGEPGGVRVRGALLVDRGALGVVVVELGLGIVVGAP